MVNAANDSAAVEGSTGVVREGPNECLRCGQEGALKISPLFGPCSQVGVEGEELSKQNTWFCQSILCTAPAFAGIYI